MGTEAEHLVVRAHTEMADRISGNEPEERKTSRPAEQKNTHG